MRRVRCGEPLPLAESLAPRLLDYDAFPEDAIFGGIRFADYRLALVCVLGFMLKHRRYCELLIERRKDILLGDILTFPCDLDDAVDYVEAATGFAPAKAAQVLSALTVDTQCVDMLLEPLSPAPSHLALGQASLVRSYTGCMWKPFNFLVRKLRRVDPPDCDRNVDLCEAVFRAELAHEFARRAGCWFCPITPKIRTPLGATDIDALCIHPPSGETALFQLKWQDAFGGSARERRSRLSNFTATSNEWVAKIDSWLDPARLPAQLRSLGAPPEIANRATSARIFVIGRHFSRFTGQPRLDPRAAWGDWNQVKRLITAGREDYMRDELYALFQGVRYARVDGSVKIRDGARTVTDIDAAVLDRMSGDLLLVQLKWQDTSRFSRKTKPA